MHVLNSAVRAIVILAVVVALAVGGAAAMDLSPRSQGACHLIDCRLEPDPEFWCDECCGSIPSMCLWQTGQCLCA
jgi:hypothetical protein